MGSCCVCDGNGQKALDMGWIDGGGTGGCGCCRYIEEYMNDVSQSFGDCMGIFCDDDDGIPDDCGCMGSTVHERH